MPFSDFIRRELFKDFIGFDTCIELVCCLCVRHLNSWNCCFCFFTSFERFSYLTCIMCYLILLFFMCLSLSLKLKPGSNVIELK